MRMEFCDICGKNIRGDASLEDLVGSRTFKECRNLDGEERELTLCYDCKNAMSYYMKNHAVLSSVVNHMNLRNRLRFLFKMPLKEYYK